MTGERLSRLYIRLIIVLALIVLAGLVYFQKKIPLGLDLKGGAELLYRIRVDDLSPSQKHNITEHTINVIRKRIDPQGRMELEIRPRGSFRFLIQLPGMGPEESRRIMELIHKSGKLLFCLVNDGSSDRMKAERGEMVIGYTPFVPKIDETTKEIGRWYRVTYPKLAQLVDEGKADGWLLVENVPGVTGEYLKSVQPATDDIGRPAVGFEFTGPGELLFAKMTEANVDKRLAIILDEDLYSAPVISERISGSGIIRGTFTQADVNDMVATLRAGALPADIELEWNNTVGAQLGEDSIRAGLFASIIALIIVVVFMAVYYLAGGIIADIAVLMTLVLVLGAMAGIQAVLTLPGIAGLVLILGMAVDANVLINERIREELARGKTLRLAVRSGYDRAFVTIMDSNLTTLITGLILFGVGTGPVKGFAMTLCLGIVISMFSAVWATRWMLELLIEKGWISRMRMLQFFGRANFSFSRVRFVAMTASAIAIVLGMTVYISRGQDKYDTDLTGGFRAEMQLQEGVPIGEFRERASKLFTAVDVQSVWSTGAEKEEAPRLFSIRISKLSDDQRISKMEKDFRRGLEQRGISGEVANVGTPEDIWRLSLRLAKPITEIEVRDFLTAVGYRETDIREIVAEGATSDEYVLKLNPNMLDENHDEQIAEILKALDTRENTPTDMKPAEALIKGEDVEVTVSPIVDESQGTLREEGDTQFRGYVTLRLDAAVSTDAVREAIVQGILGGDRPDDLRVMAHGADAGSEIAREMAVYANRATLEKIENFKNEGLRVLSFSLPASNELRIDLTSQLAEGGESGLTARLQEADVMSDGLVRAIIPIGAEASDFVLEMNELSNERAVEEIQQALLTEFAPELEAQQSVIPPKFEPVEPPEFVAAEDRTEDVRFYKMTLEPAQQVQQVSAALISAGFPNALVLPAGAITSTNAGEARTEYYVKLSNLGQLDADLQTISEALTEAQTSPFRSVEAIGEAVSKETKNKALLAIILSCCAIVFYLWFRFGEVKFGLAAVVALVHDVLMTAGAVGVADALSGTAIGAFLGFSDIKVNVTMIAAFLTLIGYSVNDTIVVFDRIRENMGGVRRRIDGALVDTSVNQTLSRTVLTGLTTLMVLVVLYIVGGPVIHGFAFVMTFGVIVGTYSSIFVASPILIGWENTMNRLRKLFRILTFRFN